MRWSWVGLGLTVGLVVAACGSAGRPRFRDPRLATGDRRFEYSHNGEVFEATNGLKILVLPDANTNLVRVDVRYRFGSAEDPKDLSGLAHLVEHLSFQLRPFGADAPSLREKLGAVALYNNAYTTWDETHYTSTATRDRLQALLEMEAHRLRANCDQLAQGDFAREREVVRQELQQRSGLGSDLSATLALAFYGEGHVYARTVIGTDEHLAAVTRDDVCDFFERHHVPERAILVVSGAVDLEQVTRLVGSLFGPIPKGAPSKRTGVTPVVLSGTASWHYLDVEEATAFIAFNVPVFTDERSVSERMLRTMFAGWIYSLEVDNDFITNAWVGSFGGVRAPLAIVAVSATSSKRLEEAVGLVFEQRTEFLEDLQTPSLGSAIMHATTAAAFVNSERANIVASVEPVADRASVFADYLQYSDHHWFVIAALRALTTLDASKLWSQASDYYFKSESHVAYVLPNPDAKTRVKRAQLKFSDSDNDLVDWAMPVDESEAERTLEVPERTQARGVREFTLRNGFRVMLQPNLSYPILDARIVFPAGLLHDPNDKPGVAELAASCLRDDYDVKLTLSQLEELKSVIRMGGSVQTDVGTTNTTFRIKGLAYFADGLLWQLNWRLESGVYSNSSLKRLADYNEEAQKQALEGKRRLQKYLGAVFGARHPHARGSVTPKERAAIVKNDLKAFRERHYRANGATLIVTGRFDVDDVEARIRRLFGSWSSGLGPAKIELAAAAARTTPAYFARFDEGDPQVTALLYRALDRGMADRARRKVLIEIVDERLSSLREQLGATYGVSVSITSGTGPGVLSISVSLDAERAGEAFVAMQNALEELRTGDLAASFVRARRKVLRGVLASTVDSRSVASELELIAAYGLSNDYLDELATSVAKLTIDDLRPLVGDVLDPERFVIVVGGREQFAKAVFDAAGISTYETLE